MTWLGRTDLPPVSTCQRPGILHLLPGEEPGVASRSLVIIIAAPRYLWPTRLSPPPPSPCQLSGSARTMTPSTSVLSALKKSNFSSPMYIFREILIETITNKEYYFDKTILDGWDRKDIWFCLYIELNKNIDLEFNGWCRDNGGPVGGTVEEQ